MAFVRPGTIKEPGSGIDLGFAVGFLGAPAVAGLGSILVYLYRKDSRPWLVAVAIVFEFIALLMLAAQWRLIDMVLGPGQWS